MANNDSSAPRRVPRRHLGRHVVDKLTVLFSRFAFAGSTRYWELRYRFKGSSGAGSYGTQARFKAEFVNRFIIENDVSSVVDFGCGDGAQLELLACPAYLGLDVSPTAVERCRSRFAGDHTKRFSLVQDARGEQADMAMSMDVVFHLVEDDVFERYLDRLFAAARRFVLIYSTNHDEKVGTHVRHRRLSDLCSKRYPRFALLKESSVAPGGDEKSARFLLFGKG